MVETTDLGARVREQPRLDQSVHLPSRLRHGYMSSLVVELVLLSWGCQIDSLSLAFMLSISPLPISQGWFYSLLPKAN